MKTVNNNDDKYNIEKNKVEVIKSLFNDRPKLNRKQYSLILGITERTLFRYMAKYKIADNLNDFRDTRGGGGIKYDKVNINI